MQLSGGEIVIYPREYSAGSARLLTLPPPAAGRSERRVMYMPSSRRFYLQRPVDFYGLKQHQDVRYASCLLERRRGVFPRLGDASLEGGRGKPGEVGGGAACPQEAGGASGLVVSSASASVAGTASIAAMASRADFGYIAKTGRFWVPCNPWMLMCGEAEKLLTQFRPEGDVLDALRGIPWAGDLLKLLPPLSTCFYLEKKSLGGPADSEEVFYRFSPDRFYARLAELVGGRDWKRAQPSAPGDTEKPTPNPKNQPETCSSDQMLRILSVFLTNAQIGELRKRLGLSGPVLQPADHEGSGGATRPAGRPAGVRSNRQGGPPKKEKATQKKAPSRPAGVLAIDSFLKKR